MQPLLSFSCFLLSLSSVVLAYDLVRDYSGTNFFDDKQGNPLWNFYGSWDNLTLGDVFWLNRSDAFTQRLAYVNDKNQVVMRVDNTTNVPYNQKRNSVRIESRDWYGVGSLWIVDIAHVPYGCSVWPAFWTYGKKWPDDGEIDILEAINLQSANQMALHTLQGCYHSTPAEQKGVDGDLDCSTLAGCVVTDNTTTSFGVGFNNVGGGVWATQFDVSGVYIWFWARGSIPSSISQTKVPTAVNVSSWGPPSASYPATSCDITEFFGAQRLVFDITLCGNWAGESIDYLPTCSGAGPAHDCYLDNVIGPGSPKYDQAYFEVNYLRAYTTGAPSPTPTGGMNNAGATALPSQQNAGVFLYPGPRQLLSLGALVGVLLLHGLW